MRTVIEVLALATLTTASTLAQQAAVPAPPAQDKANIAQVVNEDAPHLSEKDQSVACPAETEPQQAGDGAHKVDGSIKPPKAIKTRDARFPDEVRKMAKEHRKPFEEAISKVAFVVDSQGIPQNVCVQKPAGYGLDGEAVKAVKEWRFEPATKDGSPVPVHVTAEVKFRLY